MNQLVLVDSLFIQGAVAENIGGVLVLQGFANGHPIFSVSPVGSFSIDTTAASNTLTPQTRSTMYGNAYDGGGTVEYILPSPTTAQRLSISNSGGRANPLRITAPAGASIRWTDGTLHSEIISGGNELDNVMLIGESNTIWRVTFAGESDSTWTPE